MGSVEDFRKILQDFLAPELRNVAGKLESLEKRMDERFLAAEKQAELRHQVHMAGLEAFRAELRSEFAFLKLNNQAEVSRQLAPLSERVAVLEVSKQ